MTLHNYRNNLILNCEP